MYLDANVLIPMVEQQNPYAERLRNFLTPVEGAPLFSIATSELTLGECLVGPFRANEPQFAQHYETIRDDDIVELVPVDWFTMVTAARLRAENRELKLPDALHLAAAMLGGCECFVSDDRRLNASYALASGTDLAADRTRPPLAIEVRSPLHESFTPILGPR